MRVYFPSTPAAARAALDAGCLPPGTAFAVTPGMREWYAQSDGDELEYAALLAAARTALRLLDLDPASPRRRVVLAADVDDAQVRLADSDDRGAVRVLAPVPLADVAAAHIDDADAEPAVAAAADAIIEADLGGDDAAFVVDDADGYDLLWYATQELPGLLAELVGQEGTPWTP